MHPYLATRPNLTIYVSSKLKLHTDVNLLPKVRPYNNNLNNGMIPNPMLGDRRTNGVGDVPGQMWN